MSRRTFVAGAVAAATGLATSIGKAVAVPVSGHSSTAGGRRVAVLGGGIGGLTTAHELAERGFQVTVYERKAWGGKARSIPVPGTGRDGRLDLPGEHGFRFFPGFYQNLPDTMSRIPVAGNPHGVRDNLVVTDRGMGAWNGKAFYIPTSPAAPSNFTPQALCEYFMATFTAAGSVPPQDAALIASKVLTFLTSGPKRRLEQWENTSFARWMRADTLSPSGRALLVDFPTTGLVAAKAGQANTRTMGLMMEAAIHSTLRRGGYTAPDQLLNAPTNDAFIDPWLTHLRELGVRFNLGWTATGLTCDGGRITGATAIGPTGPEQIEADWFVLAVPVERAIPLLDDAVLTADPGLRRLRNLVTSWMNGVMIYTKREVPICRGHVAYVGQPWALTSISQAQFWERGFADRYGDGTAADCLSVDLSDWDTPGILYGKPAKQCTRQEIVDEVLAQIRAALPGGNSVLPDSIIHSWMVDPAITGQGTPNVANDEPLLINTPSSWANRPEATTRVPNLFLAADYVRSNVNLATMEGANEAGRAAANGILAASGSAERPAKIATLFEPPEMQPFWFKDDIDHTLGLPNQFDLLAPDWPRS
ncbi:FAD-dependent oxidoreductase [Lentzea sp. NPDC004782]|uniref:hydroxysqualene dehydroxylase n=1 Tax=Lentzea sp. NPDC004782 TaxID=3154458 RepID=UPI0033B0C4EC